MADLCRITNTLSTQPSSGTPSGQPTITSAVSESISLSTRECPRYTLTSDSPVSVALGAITNVHVLQVRCSGGKIRVRITSADGSTQSIPVDPYLELVCRSVPITALDLTRVASTETVVELFIGEAAT